MLLRYRPGRIYGSFGIGRQNILSTLPDADWKAAGIEPGRYEALFDPDNIQEFVTSHALPPPDMDVFEANEAGNATCPMWVVIAE